MNHSQVTFKRRYRKFAILGKKMMAQSLTALLAKERFCFFSDAARLVRLSAENLALNLQTKLQWTTLFSRNYDYVAWTHSSLYDGLDTHNSDNTVTCMKFKSLFTPAADLAPEPGSSAYF